MKKKIYGRTDLADPEASGEWCSGSGAMPGARDEQRDFYSWRSKHGGMYTSLISQMKSLVAENADIKRM